MREKYMMTWDEVLTRMAEVDVKGNKIFGIPRGGMICAGFLKNATNVTTPEEADIILDDVVDSGATKDRYMKQFPNKKFFTLVDFKIPTDKVMGWVVFPWESAKDDTVFDNAIRLLQFLNKRVTDRNIESIIEVVKEMESVDA